MKTIFLLLGMLFIMEAVYAEHWSKNNVWKYHAAQLYKNNTLLDHESLHLSEFFFHSERGMQTWLRTPNIYLGQDYVAKDMFVNSLAMSSNDQIVFQLRRTEDDKLLEQGLIVGNGVISLLNIFDKNVYLSMEFSSTNLNIYSFGLTRQPELVVQKKELLLSPTLLFYDQDVLDISLKLRFPAWLDLIIFDKHGTVIDRLVTDQYYDEGDYSFQWDPTQSTYPMIHSGIFMVYIRTFSTEGKVVELQSDFWVVNR